MSVPCNRGTFGFSEVSDDVLRVSWRRGGCCRIARQHQRMSICSLHSGLVRVAIAMASVVALAIAGAAPARAGTLPNAAYVPGRVLVGYAPGPIAAVTTHFETRMGIRPAGGGLSAHSRLLRLPRGESVVSAVRRLRHQPGVIYAEPDYIAHAAGSFYPNDPGRSGRAQGWEKMQWNLLPAAGVNAPEGWANLIADRRRGGRGVVVAILDTGVAYRNWDKFRQSPDFKRTHFVHPYDFVAHNRYPLDRNGHGTFVAGRGRRGHQQQDRPDRDRLRRLDHAGSHPRCERPRRRGHDRPRDPLRGQSRCSGDQPQPRVPAQRGLLGIRHPGDRQRVELRALRVA